MHSMDSEDTEAASQSLRPALTRKPRRQLWRDTQRWTRWLHVYTSMLALLVVLFFGITGITVNHPEWTFGFGPTSETSTGTLPSEWQGPDGEVQFLVVSEFVRSDYGVKGDVSDFGSDTTAGFISYRGPGYGADIFFSLDSGEYELTVEQQGWVGVINDLHKGRDTDSSWNWLIDVSGAFLVLIALTGLGLQLFLKRRRRAALMVGLAGTIATGVFWFIAVN